MLVALHQRLPTSFADRYIGKDCIVFIVFGKDCYVSRAAAVAGSDSRIATYGNFSFSCFAYNVYLIA